MKKILLVDDDKETLELIKGVLQKYHFIVIALENGDNVIEYIAKEKIDLVILDIVMPGMSGDEILIKIREKYSPLELPVLMQTGKTDKDNHARSLKNGANDFFTKPLDFNILHTRINTQLQLCELSHSLSLIKQAEALKAMIITYKHELNNPLAILQGQLNLLAEEDLSPRATQLVSKLSATAIRMQKVIQSISDISNKQNIAYNKYFQDGPTMIDINSRKKT